MRGVGLKDWLVDERGKKNENRNGVEWKGN